MEFSIIMDNDSGYGSHNQESNLDSSSENVETKTCAPGAVYFNEDALLEKPLISSCIKGLKCSESFDSVINSSQDSVRTEFSGFEDSEQSDMSFIIPEVKEIVYDSREWQHNEPAPGKIQKPPLVPHKVLANVTNTYDQNPPVMKNVLSDKENVNPITTPKKRYENPVTSDISPDLFAEEDPPKPKSPMKKTTPREVQKDQKLLKNVQSLLCGVHPPPCVTINQMSATQMLEKLDENKDLFWKASTITKDMGKSLLVNDGQECVNWRWPGILKARFHGLHYNRSKTSEDFEHLCLRYAERYVGAETQSSCTVFDSNPPSSQKRKMLKPRWSAKSPGRRLSHLARRRITFSSANLQANSSSAILGSRARQILVDARKLSLMKKSPKKSPRKTPSKSPFKLRKATPSSSAKKKLARRFREMSGEFESIVPNTSEQNLSFKRALFSDDKETSFAASIEKKSTKRALFLSPLKHSPSKRSPLKSYLDKKRKRTDSDCSNASKLSRSMSLDVPKTASNSLLSRTFSENFNRKPEELSDQHKKKLQWAVYESLRLQNVTPTHPQYKVFASVLARVMRRFLPGLKFEGRTTEKMFRVARHHSYAVVKGKTVDEIVNEYMRNRLKNQKPHGYVGIEEFKAREGKENVLQDKGNVMEGVNRGLSQNRIDRIRKVISFEDKEG